VGNWWCVFFIILLSIYLGLFIIAGGGFP